MTMYKPQKHHLRKSRYKNLNNLFHNSTLCWCTLKDLITFYMFICLIVRWEKKVEYKDKTNDCWTRSRCESHQCLILGLFLINNPLFLLRLKDVLGQRLQHSTRKPPSASPQHSVKNINPTHCFYLGLTWTFDHSCKVYKMADHPCSAAKIY